MSESIREGVGRWVGGGYSVGSLGSDPVPRKSILQLDLGLETFGRETVFCVQCAMCVMSDEGSE